MVAPVAGGFRPDPSETTGEGGNPHFDGVPSAPTEGKETPHPSVRSLLIPSHRTYLSSTSCH